MRLQYLGPEPTQPKDVVTFEDLGSPTAETIWVPLSGQWLLDPNEANGWGVVGPYDPTNTQELGNVGATSWSWVMGGFTWPFDVKLTRFKCFCRENNNAVQAWGWTIAYGQQVDNSTASIPITRLLDEVGDNGGAGPRDFGNTRPHLVDVSTFANGGLLPAGNTLTVAVESPTADGTNRYIQVSSGFLLFEKV